MNRVDFFVAQSSLMMSVVAMVWCGTVRCCYCCCCCCCCFTCSNLLSGNFCAKQDVKDRKVERDRESTHIRPNLLQIRLSLVYYYIYRWCVEWKRTHFISPPMHCINCWMSIYSVGGEFKRKQKEWCHLRVAWCIACSALYTIGRFCLFFSLI